MYPQGQLNCNSTPVRVGVELETHAPKDLRMDAVTAGLRLISANNIHMYWNPVRDGSLGDRGCEFVLSQPTPSGPDLTFQVESLLHSLEKANFTHDHRCGTHIHIDCKDLSSRDLTTFTVMVVMAQHLLYQLCGRRRIVNNFTTVITVDAQFCQLLSAILSSVYVPCESDHVIPASSLKYSGINLWSLTKNNRGSVEFRMFPATFKAEELNFWIQLLVTIRQRSERIRGIGGLVTILREIKDPMDLLGVLFGKNEELISTLKNSMFKTQLQHSVTEGLRDGLFASHYLLNESSKG